MPKTTLLVFQEAPNSAPLMDWLDDLEDTNPKAYVKCLQRIQQLEQSGFDLRRPAADTVRDGVYELRAKLGRVHYRILYVFCGKNTACLTQGFTKKGAIPNIEIERAIKAKKLVEDNRALHTVEWEV